MHVRNLDEMASKRNDFLCRLSDEELENMLRSSVFSDEVFDADQTRQILSELEYRKPTSAHSTPEEAWVMFQTYASDDESAHIICSKRG